MRRRFFFCHGSDMCDRMSVRPTVAHGNRADSPSYGLALLFRTAPQGASSLYSIAKARDPPVVPM